MVQDVSCNEVSFIQLFVYYIITFHPFTSGPLPVLDETNLVQSNSSGGGSPDEGRSEPISTVMTSLWLRISSGNFNA